MSHVPDPDPEHDLEEQARADFEVLVDEAVAAIPKPFSAHLGGVAIVVEDDPRPGQAPPGQLLFGLYQGVPRTAWGASGAPHASKITIFRRPHELMYRDRAARAQAVQGTVLHEVAHYFGIDETQIRSIEAGRRRAPGHR